MKVKDTLILKVTDKLDKSDIENLTVAADILRRGGLVAFPTETVYGLGANALDKDAVNSIFEAKGRPQDNPLIVHVSDKEDIDKYADTKNPLFLPLKEQMPSPLTVILPKKDIIPSVVTAGLDSVAMRVPESVIARKLIELSGVPVAAPSANLSGKPSPTTAQHVISDMEGKVDCIIDAGVCSVGVESTVISLCESVPTLFRPGGFTLEMLQNLIGKVKVSDAVLSSLKSGSKVQSPGMKYKHYAPSKPVCLLKGDSEKIRAFLKQKYDTEKCAIICYDEDFDLSSDRVLLMGKRNSSKEYATRLFDALRKTDLINNTDCVYAVLPDDTSGISLAIYNRMLRAAAFNVREL